MSLRNMEEFFDYVNQVFLNCSKGKFLGGANVEGYRDGQKFVCFDEGIVKGNCNVLSFGINNEWSFDDAIAKYKCKVYAFDPSMGIWSHRRSKYVQFYNVGIGSFKGNLHKNKEILKVDRYENLLKRVKLIDSEIFYLKMDVEGSELDFFEDIFTTTPHLLKNIHQIGMEIHPGTYEGKDGINPAGLFEQYWKYFQLLEQYGFQLMYSAINPLPRTQYIYKGKLRGSCYEMVWTKREDILSSKKHKN